MKFASVYLVSVSLIFQGYFGEAKRDSGVSKPLIHGSSCKPKGTTELMDVEQLTRSTTSTVYTFKCTCSGVWSTTWNCVPVTSKASPAFSGSGNNYGVGTGSNARTSNQPSARSTSNPYDQIPANLKPKKKVGKSPAPPKSNVKQLHGSSCKDKERGTSKLVTQNEPSGFGNQEALKTYRCTCTGYLPKWSCGSSAAMDFNLPPNSNGNSRRP